MYHYLVLCALANGLCKPFDDGESESEPESDTDFADFAHNWAKGTPPPPNLDHIDEDMIICTKTGRVVDLDSGLAAPRIRLG